MGVLLVLLGVALVVAVAAGLALLAVRLRRARFCPSSPTFPCAVRRAGRVGHPATLPWPRRRWRAVWAHDVLVLEHGVLLPTVVALPIRMPEAALRDAGTGEIPRLRGAADVVLLRLDDDSLIEVAAEHARRTDLVGPFMAAAIPGLPRGPREQRNLGR